MKGLRICCLLLALFAIAADSAYSRSGNERRIDKTYKADSIESIEVSAHVGSISVVSSDDQQIRLVLVIEPEKFKDVDLEAVDLIETSDGNLLKFRTGCSIQQIKYQRKNGSYRFSARLQANLEIKVGDVHVKGLAGGLKLNTNVGKISCDVPEGRIHARAGERSIKAFSRTSPYGKVQLDSNVGDVKLNESNHLVNYPKPAGAGNRISLE